MAATDLTLRAMGCEARVVVVGDDSAARAERAVTRIRDLERRWSRFRSGSEVSRCNGRTGAPNIVSPETLDLVAHAVDAWRRSGGRYDPTVLGALERIGYTTSREDVPDDDPAPLRTPEPAPGCGAVVVDRVVGSVTLPASVRFDPGGIGKGFAADLTATELVADGATGALVSIGGDLRVVGAAPDGTRSWSVVVEHPFDRNRVIAELEVADGGVATSSRRLRRWRRAGDTVHHVIDPATGAPARTGTWAATAVAATAWEAEAAATSALVAPARDAAAALGALAIGGLVVHADGTVEHVEPEAVEPLAGART